ncbi:MAG: TrkA family potassium uptake protein [Pseudomonadota bacterium]|nr:TrkA family potassium uptake protein [Pseudomonadota bacterium]
MSQYAVIGLGSFGATAARELMRLGHDVIGIDSEAKFVDKIAADITYAAIADATDEQALRELNIEACDAVVVAIGENLEASILCVLHLKNLGIGQIWVKAKSKAHHMILSRLGVARIIHPEEEMGIRIAQALNYPMVSQYMSLGHHHFIVAVEISRQLHGICLSHLIADYDKIRVMMVKRQHQIITVIQAEFLLELGDTLILEGPLAELNRLAPKVS